MNDLIKGLIKIFSLTIMACSAVLYIFAAIKATVKGKNSPTEAFLADFLIIYGNICYCVYDIKNIILRKK